MTLAKGGIDFNGKLIPFEFRCFIADVPARAFSLGHKGHNSWVPCSRCWLVGEYLGPGLIIYRGTNFQARAEDEYRLRIDGEHHQEEDCPLGRLPLNFVSQTVFDYIHLVCLAVMEKILQAVVDGKYSKSAKISSGLVKILSDRLEQVKKCCPSEFARKPTDIDKHSKFKATELRQLLLYSGPAVFYGLVNQLYISIFFFSIQP